MLYGAVMFAVAAAVAGMVGFGGFASASAALARILLLLFVFGHVSGDVHCRDFFAF
jgi:uncharacterized membrane protein YtjA (UPF0391 family)